jgi:hypothetical protein
MIWLAVWPGEDSRRRVAPSAHPLSVPQQRSGDYIYETIDWRIAEQQPMLAR